MLRRTVKNPVSWLYYIAHRTELPRIKFIVSLPRYTIYDQEKKKLVLTGISSQRYLPLPSCGSESWMERSSAGLKI